MNMMHKSGEDRRLGHDRRDACTNAVSDPRTGRLHGFVRQVRIASGRLNLRITEELGDHRQAFAESNGPGRKVVALTTKQLCSA